MTDTLAVPPSEVRRVVFLGTPDEAATALKALSATDIEVALVVSQPDRRRGRGSKMIPSPVKQVAMDLDLPVSDKLGDVHQLAGSVDLGVVVAYGKIIPVELLANVAMVNIHFSLLPRWRGAAPVERAILAGDQETGVCLMEVAEGLDEGGVYARRVLPIGENQSALELRAQLAQVGSDLLVDSLLTGLPNPEPQLGEPTYARKIDKAEGLLDFTQPAIQLHRRVRVGRAWTEFRGRRLGIEKTLAVSGKGEPGLLSGPLVATPDGMLELIEVKPEGKRTMAVDDWLNGVQIQTGERLG